jgi:hypothetical protein
MESGRFQELAREVLRSHSPGESVLRGILTKDAYRRWKPEAAIEPVAAHLQKCAEAGNPIGAFYFWNRTRRQISLGPFSICATLGDVYAPYLDHELYDFLAALPASMTVDHLFHTDALRRAYPDFADIPFARKTKGPRYTRQNLRRHAVELAKFVWQHRGGDIVSSSFVTPHILRGLAVPLSCEALAWLGPLAIYLVQLQSTGRLSPVNLSYPLHERVASS